MANHLEVKIFDLNLLVQALHPLPYAQIGNQLILLTAILHVTAHADGAVTLSLVNGSDVRLALNEMRELEHLLRRGIEAAQTQAARQAAQNLGLIPMPGKAH